MEDLVDHELQRINVETIASPMASVGEDSEKGNTAHIFEDENSSVADKNHEDSDMDNTPVEAIKTGNLEAVIDWLATLSPGDLNAVEYKGIKICLLSENDECNGTALHLAGFYNQPAIVKLLLDQGADPNKKDSRDNSNALHIACCYNNSTHDILEVVKLLIERNCNIDAQNANGCTPLHIAVRRGHTAVVRILLEINANLQSRDKAGDQPIHVAAPFGNHEIIKALVDKNAECVHWKDECNRTLLDLAVTYGHVGIVKQLIRMPQWPYMMRHTFKQDNGKETTVFRKMIKMMPEIAEEILNRCTVNNPKIQNFDDHDYTVVFNYEFIEDARDNDNERVEETEIENKYQKDEEHKHRWDYETICWRPDTTSWGPVGFKKANHPLAIMVKYNRLNLLTHPLVGSLLHYKWTGFGLYGYFLNLLAYCVFLIFLTAFALTVENPRSQSCSSVSSNLSDLSDNGTGCNITTARLSFIYISAIVVIISSLCRLVLEGIQFVTQFPGYVLDWINWMEIVLYLFSIIFVWVFHVDCLCPLTWQWQIGVVAVFLGWVDLIVFISKFPLTGIYVLIFVKIVSTFLKILVLSLFLVLAFGLTFYLVFTQPEILRTPFSTPGISLIKLMSMTAGDFDFDSIFHLDPAGGSDDAEEIPFPPVSYMLWIVFVIVMPILLTNMLVGLAVGDIQAIQDEAEIRKLALQVEQVLTVEELLPRKWRRQFTTGRRSICPNQAQRKSWIEKLTFIMWGGKRYDTRAIIEKVLNVYETSVDNENEKKADEMVHHIESLKDENKTMQTKTDKLLHEVEDLKNSVHEKIQRNSNDVLEEIEGLKTSAKDENEKIQKMTDKLQQKVDNLKTSMDSENEKVNTKTDEIVHQIANLKTSVDDEKKKNDEVLHKVENLKASVDESVRLVHEVEDLKTSVDNMKQLLKQIAIKLERTD